MYLTPLLNFDIGRLARKMCRVLYQAASSTGFMKKYRGEV